MRPFRIFNYVLIIASATLVFGCTKPEPSVLQMKGNWEIQSSAKLSDNGTQISSSNYRPTGWYPVTVPTTVLAGLVENKVYPDPYYGENLKAIPGYKTGSWISMDKASPFYNPWWYRTTFTLPDNWKGQYLSLHLNGINLKANVWLNGHQIADSSNVVGMFRRFEFNINDWAKIGEENTLAIEVIGPGRIPDIKYYTKQIEATTGWDDHNPQPPDLNMGVWQNVFISADGPVTIRHPYVVTDLDLPSLAVAHLTVSAKLINSSNKKVTGKLTGLIESVRFEKEVTLEPLESKLVEFNPSEYNQLNINNPRIWWPHTVGKQELYNMKLTFETGGSTSAQENTRFGIREVSTYINDEGWRGYQVNGKIS